MGHFSSHKLLAHGCHDTHLELRFYGRLCHKSSYSFFCVMAIPRSNVLVTDSS